MGKRALSLEVKRPRREADYSPPSSAKVKNAWSYTSTPPIRLDGVLFDFTFYFSLVRDQSRQVILEVKLADVWTDGMIETPQNIFTYEVRTNNT
jgi:hypothetical protein